MQPDISAAQTEPDDEVANLRWSAWMPLMAAHPLALAQLPSEPGIYRIRRAGRPDRLVWIGWEPRGVRETVERLSRQVHMPIEPFDDPRNPARLLWNMRRQEGIGFEVSGAPVGGETASGSALVATLRAHYGLLRSK